MSPIHISLYGMGNAAAHRAPDLSAIRWSHLLDDLLDQNHNHAMSRGNSLTEKYPTYYRLLSNAKEVNQEFSIGHEVAGCSPKLGI
jgi:hypothetical protein